MDETTPPETGVDGLPDPPDAPRIRRRNSLYRGQADVAESDERRVEMLDEPVKARVQILPAAMHSVVPSVAAVKRCNKTTNS